MIADEHRTNLNLLPTAYRRRVLVRAGIALWASIGTFGLLAASVVIWRADRVLASVHDELSKFERMYAPTQFMARELRPMRLRLVELEIEEEAAAGLEDDRPTLALLGMIGKASAACDGRLHVRECQLLPPPQEGGPNVPNEQLLTLRGAAMDLVTIAKFQGALRDCGMFRRVELQPTAAEPIGDVDGHTFHIKCAF